jgi:uncharacterized protein YjbI with pentapeptide repeats
MKVAWRDVNPAPGVFDWSILDRRVAQVESWGGRPLLVLGLTPQWAAADPAAGDPRWGPGSASPPVDFANWALYVQAVSSRYGDRIGAYELWNEANLKTFWQGTPEQMAELSLLSYPIIKQNSPNATVLTPSVTTRLSSGGRFTAGYLTSLEAGGSDLDSLPFDAFAIHTYPAGNAGVNFDGSCSADPDDIAQKISVGLPEFAQGKDKGVFVRWLKSVGELVAADEPLFVVSDGKREFPIASPESGLLRQTLVEAGANIKVGQELAIITDGQTPEDCVAGRNPKAAAQKRVADVVQWQQAVLNVGDLWMLPIWDTEVNYGLAGPGIIPGVGWSDEQGAQLMGYTFADSAALGIDNTFWYQFTARPFDLLGVQMTPETPATLSAWTQPASARSSAFSYSTPVINGCPISFFTKCPGADLKSKNLSSYTFGSANLDDADLYRADLSNTDLVGSSLQRARLFEANLFRLNAVAADFTRANMRSVNARNANFVDANLRGVDFGKANLQGANFRGANLTGANFFGADLRGANLCNTTITNANFKKAKAGAIGH